MNTTFILIRSVLRSCRESDPEKACAELEDYYEFIGHVGEGLAGDTIEMIPKGFSKAVGIAAVCRIFDIAHEETIVFGDSNNDLSMFEYAKTKVAMEMRHPESRSWLIT